MNLQFRTFFDPQPYEETFEKMRMFTHERTQDCQDEIWFLEHTPVFTQGQAGKPEHILNPGEIPVVQSDRGGQVTYHGPGQLMVYCLVDLRRRNLGVRDFVTALENTFIELMGSYGLKSHARQDAPGVYLEQGTKIASIGLRVRKGFSYHGVSFNLTTDLTPFQWINPCGFKNLTMTKLNEHVQSVSRADVETRLQRLLKKHLSPLDKQCPEYVA